MTGIGPSPLQNSLNNLSAQISNLTFDEINGILPVSKGGTGANNIIDGANNIRAYGFEKFSGNLTINGSQSRTSTIQLTTHGKPIFMCIAGDWNGTIQSAWIRIDLYIDGKKVAGQIAHESHQASSNRPFCRTYMTIPSAGSHTFQAKIEIGAGEGTIGEEGEIQSPCFTVFEI